MGYIWSPKFPFFFIVFVSSTVSRFINYIYYLAILILFSICSTVSSYFKFNFNYCRVFFFSTISIISILSTVSSYFNFSYYLIFLFSPLYILSILYITYILYNLFSIIFTLSGFFNYSYCLVFFSSNNYNLFPSTCITSPPLFVSSFLNLKSSSPLLYVWQNPLLQMWYLLYVPPSHQFPKLVLIAILVQLIVCQIWLGYTCSVPCTLPLYLSHISILYSFLPPL